MPEGGDTPLLIDCNPRRVEPMSAYLAGTDLVGLLLQLSRGETPPALRDSREVVRTHLAMQALLGCAARGGTLRNLLRECRRLLLGAASSACSTEVLMPVCVHWNNVT